MAVLQPGAIPQGNLPRDLGRADRRFFTFILPILLVVNVPAATMVRVLEPRMIAFTLAATAALLWASRRFFQRSLRSYRSASS